MTPEQKAQIDNASTTELLRKWRHGGGGPLFRGECGEYYQKVLFGRRDADPGAWVAASKEVGW